jgi:hypothetical protein
MATLALAGLSVAQPASGAKPLRRGHYAGAAGQIVSAVHVSANGRTLTSAGSYVKVNSLVFGPECVARPRVALVDRGRRVRVDRRGRFSIVRRFDGNVLRAHGRFLTPYTARLVFRVRPASGFPCDPGPLVVMLHPRGVDPPFTGCREQTATTLLASADARIFDQRKVFYGYYYRPVAYGCLFSVGKRFELGLDDPDPPTGDADSSDAGDFHLAGPYTAYVLSYLGAVQGSDVVEVVDLRDGSRLVPRSDEPSPPDVAAPRLVRGIVLKDNGSVAWIQNSSFSQEEQVWAHDALSYRKLDSAPRGTGSPSITSLQLTGSTLTWLHDGEPRSATLD